MLKKKRIRIGLVAVVTVIACAGIAVTINTVASASTVSTRNTVSTGNTVPTENRVSSENTVSSVHKLSLSRFDLRGYVINADYRLGRNTGNTFQQTYADSTVQGVPIAGPDVGVQFPREDYVALPIGNDELYVTWLDPATDAIVDVFVMNFRTHVVYDYAPGSTSPESAGVITIVHRGAHRIS